MTEKRSFLVSCHYDEYCQGWESSWGYFLVHNVQSFREACAAVEQSVKDDDDIRNLHAFHDHTIIVK